MGLVMWWLMWVGCGAGSALDMPKAPPEWPASNSAAGDAVAPVPPPKSTESPTNQADSDTDATDTDATPETPPGVSAPAAAAPVEIKTGAPDAPKPPPSPTGNATPAPPANSPAAKEPR